MNGDFVGINVIGHVSGNLGLSVVTRGLIHAMLRKGIQLRLLDVDPGEGRGGFDTRFSKLCVDTTDKLIFDINLFVFPPQTLRKKLIAAFSGTGQKFNVAYVYWELPDLPKECQENLENLDAVIAPSDFIFDSLSRAVRNTHLIKGRTAYFLPELSPGRIKEEDAFKVFTSFEPFSDLQRKNPIGSINAFQRAFPEDPGVELTVKINNSKSESGAIHAPVSHLIEQFGSDRRIKFDLERYGHGDLLKYYSSFDLAISLHRAEGFGLMPLEMMLMGVPVVATNWSGNVDYMRAGNSFPVRYSMKPADGSFPLYQSEYYARGTNWAEPNLDDAISCLRLARTMDLSGISDTARSDAYSYMVDANKLAFIDDVVHLKDRMDWRG